MHTVPFNTMSQTFMPSGPSSLVARLQSLPTHDLLSCEERLRVLLQLSRMNSCSSPPKNSPQRDTVCCNVPVSHNPSACERRHRERLQAKANFALMKVRKAQLANWIPPGTLSGSQTRRISSLTEPLPSPPLATSFEDENSTICMHVSNLGDEEDLLEYQNLDDIFDDEDSGWDDSLEESRDNFVGPLNQTKQTPIETFPLGRQVSRASYGDTYQEQSQRRPRNLTPKEAGMSSWDDVSSIATLSRLGGFEPEPLPMGDSPIPFVIFVPTTPAAAVEEDWLEPLSVFPPGYSPSNSLAGRTDIACTNQYVGTFAS